MKALDLVRKAVGFGDRLARARSRGELRGEAVFVHAVRLTLAMTKQLSRMPRNTPSATERAALQIAAAQLRHIGATIAGSGGAAPDTAPGAMTDLIVGMLDLIDELLDGPKEVPPGERIEVRELPPRG